MSAKFIKDLYNPTVVNIGDTIEADPTTNEIAINNLAEEITAIESYLGAPADVTQSKDYKLVNFFLVGTLISSTTYIEGITFPTKIHVTGVWVNVIDSPVCQNSVFKISSQVGGGASDDLSLTLVAGATKASASGLLEILTTKELVVYCETASSVGNVNITIQYYVG